VIVVLFERAIDVAKSDDVPQPYRDWFRTNWVFIHERTVSTPKIVDEKLSPSGEDASMQT
jgi:hypothetical protein